MGYQVNPSLEVRRGGKEGEEEREAIGKHCRDARESPVGTRTAMGQEAASWAGPLTGAKAHVAPAETR